MKRSVLLGLFVTASMLASSSFAAGEGDLCDTNIKTIENLKTQIQGTDLEARAATSVQQAKAYRDQKTEEGTKKCISETTQTLQEIQKVNKDGKNS
ncbi:hypothetical protein [Pseudomonas uvaldensis]|uniref:hypothetical protein n=1 Tax=Pseudomonas uvaldensis TaxID=2878385 RepID=UPI001E4957B8|nr:hypothetical protein [Pseudomonas uvaldensis]MCE0461134.1 hypothetical protein [Pseudomonas uvaldensis]